MKCTDNTRKTNSSTHRAAAAKHRVSHTGNRSASAQGTSRQRTAPGRPSPEARRRYQQRKARRKKQKKILFACMLALIAIICIAGGVYVWQLKKEESRPTVTQYETSQYKQAFAKLPLISSDLAVAKENVSPDGYEADTSLHASGLFDLTNKTVLQGYQLHEQLFPASTTKIMTALLALEKGDITDTVTVSKHAAAESFPSDAQLCGLHEGDQLTLEDLLYALLLYSGNDAATAIAEHISGSEEKFVDEMNTLAKELMAVNTNFVNPHGLHDNNHYTTAYDLYLIFNECIKNETFLNIIGASSYTAEILQADGSTYSATWEPTNYYAKGLAEVPENATILGGKTGTTGDAGNCLILLAEDKANNPYISVVMGAATKTLLYQDMSALISAIPGGEQTPQS